MAKRVAVRACTLHPPAKINLTLRVSPRRADGFHDVETVLQSIALSDTLLVRAAEGEFSLRVREPGVPSDRTNLVWKAADALWRALGRPGEPRDVSMRLEKSIPAAAGLGGGSADAAAALVALNTIWRGGLSRGDLMAIGATLGSDVPFALMGGTALGVGRGERLYPLDDIPRMGVVLIVPAFGVATADAYRWFDEDAGHPPNVERPEPCALDVSWATGRLRLGNDLEPPVSRRHTEIGTMIDACLAAGARAAAMTGSGSAVYGLFPLSAVHRAARRLARPGWLVLATRTLARRDAVRLMGL